MCFFLVSCYGQEAISVKINNRSSITIDSISTDTQKIKCAIKPNMDTIIDISIKNKDIYHEGAIGMNIYQKGKPKNATIGFHDMGQISKFDVYVFNEGIFYKNNPIMPKELIVYFYNVEKKSKIDTIISPSIVKIKEASPRRRKIIFDYNKIKNSPIFSIIISGKKYDVNLDHDFKNWNTNQYFLYFYEDKFTREAPKSIEPFEYEVLISSNSSEKILKVESSCNCIERAYYNQNTANIILDYQKFLKSSDLKISTDKNIYEKKYTKEKLLEFGNAQLVDELN